MTPNEIASDLRAMSRRYIRKQECKLTIETAARRLEALQQAGEAVYMAGAWTCDRPADSQALWAALRDALGLPEGTARSLGVVP